VAAALSVTVTAAVQQELSDLIKIQSVDVSWAVSTLQVDLTYIVLATGASATQTVLVPGG
jgi:hypothetical protein